jgi:hypothetical protein
VIDNLRVPNNFLLAVWFNQVQYWWSFFLAFLLPAWLCCIVLRKTKKGQYLSNHLSDGFLACGAFSFITAALKRDSLSHVISDILLSIAG